MIKSWDLWRFEEDSISRRFHTSLTLRFNIKIHLCVCITTSPPTSMWCKVCRWCKGMCKSGWVITTICVKEGWLGILLLPPFLYEWAGGSKPLFMYGWVGGSVIHFMNMWVDRQSASPEGLRWNYIKLNYFFFINKFTAKAYCNNISQLLHKEATSKNS